MDISQIRRIRSGLGLMVALLVLLPVVLVGLLAGPAQAADDPGSGRVVRVGTEGTYPPFTYVDPRTSQLTGYDIEVAKAVAKEAGWRLKFVQSQFDAIFPALDSKRIDMIANQVTINPERQARYLFSKPYTYSHGVIVVAKGKKGITSLDDLKGKTTAQSETSNWAQVAKDAGAKVESVEGFAQAVALLTQGRVDAIVNDNIAVLDYLASTKSTKIEITGDAGDEVSKQALTFRKSDPELRKEADAALKKLAEDGTLAKISKSYFGADVSVEKSSADVKVKGSDTGRSTWEVMRARRGPDARGRHQGHHPADHHQLRDRAADRARWPRWRGCPAGRCWTGSRVSTSRSSAAPRCWCSCSSSSSGCRRSASSCPGSSRPASRSASTSVAMPRRSSVPRSSRCRVASSRRRPRSGWTTARACGASCSRRPRGSPYPRCRTPCSRW